MNLFYILLMVAILWGKRCRTMSLVNVNKPKQSNHLIGNVQYSDFSLNTKLKFVFYQKLNSEPPMVYHLYLPSVALDMPVTINEYSIT